MSEPDQPGEQFDDELLADEFPPEEPLGAERRGTTGQEADSIEERDERLDPDGQAPPEVVVETGVLPTNIDDPEDAERFVPVEEEGETGPLAEDDDFSGDETTRDVATERVSRPAEEAAMHVETEPRRPE